jgi:hypothetical protein
MKAVERGSTPHSSLVIGVAERPNDLVIDLDAARRNHKSPVVLLEGVVGGWFVGG